MTPPTATLAVLLFFALSVGSSSSLPPEDGIRIVSAEKMVHLAGPIVRVFLTLEVENAPTAPDASEVLLAFTPREVEHLAIVKATRVEGKHRKRAYEPPLVIASDVAATPNGARLHSVLLNTHLKPGEATTLEVVYVLTHFVDPSPAEISQSEPQLVYYDDTAVMLSPYHVLEQVTYIKMPSNRIEDFAKVDPYSRAGTEVKYGPYNNQMPITYVPIFVYYENHPFAVVEKLERWVDIPRRGHIKVTEQYKMKRYGAWYKRIFSRIECPSWPFISALLSSSNKDRLYYGVIQGPRYPLFSGCTFTTGYGLALQDFLIELDDGRRYINLTFGCPLLETVVDDFTITVVLPEGSKNPQPMIPFRTATSYSYLYRSGRAKVVLKKKNIVGEHSVPFQVYYESNPILMLVEPIKLWSAVLVIIVVCVTFYMVFPSENHPRPIEH
ncbi:hypothetical protein ACP70R_041846 [Stipagrostis hirtigluma subsp. patula]